jgi:hypothetical protein
MISCTRLADWPNRVYVSCDEEEEGYSAAAADGKTEEWELEYVRCDFGIVGGRVQPGYEGGAKVTRYNHKGCDAAEALGGVVLATVTQTCWGAGATYIYPIGVAGRHAGETKKQKSWTREEWTMVQWKRE